MTGQVSITKAINRSVSHWILFDRIRIPYFSHDSNTNLVLKRASMRTMVGPLVDDTISSEMPNGPRSRIFQLPASDHPHYTAEAHPTYLETTPQSSVPTVGGGRVFGQLRVVHDARTLSLAWTHSSRSVRSCGTVFPGDNLQPFPRADSYLLNNPIRSSTCTRVSMTLRYRYILRVVISFNLLVLNETGGDESRILWSKNSFNYDINVDYFKDRSRKGWFYFYKRLHCLKKFDFFFAIRAWISFSIYFCLLKWICWSNLAHVIIFEKNDIKKAKTRVFITLTLLIIFSKFY